MCPFTLLVDNVVLFSRITDVVALFFSNSVSNLGVACLAPCIDSIFLRSFSFTSPVPCVPDFLGARKLVSPFRFACAQEGVQMRLGRGYARHFDDVPKYEMKYVHLCVPIVLSFCTCEFGR